MISTKFYNNTFLMPYPAKPDKKISCRESNKEIVMLFGCVFVSF
ncbi:hypothetical protein AB91_4622 [Escherichia coli 2-460-02_S3_C1]|nr:hypothetical protein AB91_4622 [Escherichia coli 2-460-02_S3_C1]KDY56922.1 hypothetical protein AC20_4627 [Escherichia coli 2-460-02_S3_C2]